MSRGGSRRRAALALLAACLAFAASAPQAPSNAWAQAAASTAKPSREPDVPYQPSSPEVVQAMLKLANVNARDVVYDLGCGDGRIVIAAVRDYGARGVCVDIDPQRIAEARENARNAGVERRIRFETQDLFMTDIHDASVVMLFLWPGVNLSLKPKLMRELAPGARVVSHWHDMGEWKPQQTIRIVSASRERPIYLWIIPPR